MITSVSDWVAFLHACDALTGIPFVLSGVAMMLLGWRMWKFAVVLTFALIGLMVGVALAQTPSQAALYGVGGAVALGLASFPPVHQSIAVLGGLIGAGMVRMFLESVGLEGVPLWIAVALTLLVVTPLCAINRKQVIILITAFQGAVLMISGLAILVRAEPTLRGTYEQMSEYSAIVGPFVLLVPTVIGVFLQMADVRQRERGN